MKEYKKPEIEFLQFSMKDVVLASGGGERTGSDTETEEGSLFGTMTASIDMGARYQ